METINNGTIFRIDWARADRQNALRKSKRAMRIFNSKVANGSSGFQECGADASEMDPRSVKASLRSRGDLRVFWWDTNVAIHRIIFPKATMEEIMYAFHSRHHLITLLRLRFKLDVHHVSRSLLNNGLMAGVKAAHFRFNQATPPIAKGNLE